MYFRLLLISALFLITACCPICKKSTTHIDSSVNIQSYVSGNKPVVACFSSDWCRSCKKFEPIYKDMKAKMTQEAEFIKIDTTHDSSLMDKYSITSLPSVIIVNPKTDDYLYIPYRLLWEPSDFEEYLLLHLKDYSPEGKQ